ncbi:toll-like receptor 2 [Pomacea canaliculata]|uniref:toll-like receptor 2 n=1 Tax=Pomacea canaliculata TaxID=400727 RepID=UPI000D72B36A|nr:toll-like receptor 2 [Pomacea canaliculata]
MTAGSYTCRGGLFGKKDALARKPLCDVYVSNLIEANCKNVLILSLVSYDVKGNTFQSSCDVTALPTPVHYISVPRVTMDVRLVVWCAVLQLVVRSTSLSLDDETFHRHVPADNSSLSVLTTDNNVSYCFEKKCKCSGDEADCSKNYGALTFVPKLPNTVQFLNFSFNNLTTIDSADFFQNVTYITSLDLGNNGLRYIHPQAFGIVKGLKYLFLDDNQQLNYTVLQPVLFVKTLVRLDIIHGGLGPLPTNFFYRFPLPRLQYTYWHGNDLKFLNFTAVKPLRKLKIFGVASNRLSDVHSDFMIYLEELVISHNALQDFPATCSSNGTSFFPRLAKFFITDNLLFALTANICLPGLQVLDLSRNRFTLYPTDMFSSQKFPRLIELFLDEMYDRKLEIQRRAFNNTVLERITLLKNDINFHTGSVDAESFMNCPKLTGLGLSENNLRYVDDSRFFQLFGRITNLEYLFLGNSFITQVTPKTFASLKKLQKLYLYGNDLRALPDGVFDENNLKVLDLGRNKLSQLSPLTFSESTKRKLTSLDISNNFFSCSCDLIWFRDWLLAQPTLFADSQGRYMCSDRQNITIMSFYLPDQACLMSADAYKFIVASVAIMTFTLMMLSSLYRYRWHIRLVLYETFRDRSGERKRRLQDHVYNYDVFVSYAEEDLRWVQTRLMPEVEQRLGLRLCVHQRDFIPGKNIVDNIVDSVNDSKKILMVFSTNFARSHWCQFELAFCLHHILEKGDDLIIVCLEDILSRDLTSAMMAVLKTNTYIQWQDQPDAAASFWGRLKIALCEVLPQSA